MVKPDNSGEYFILLVSDFTCRRDSLVITLERSGVREVERWVGGEKQAKKLSPAQIYYPIKCLKRYEIVFNNC
jgi:hypothetical protein